MYNLENLTPEQFAWLAVALLKREVSPAVRMTSLRGPDGGRDAVFLGPSVTRRYDWTGQWVFQFKHYTGQPASNRSRILRDLRNELTSVKDLYNLEVDNYVFVTSVPFSGPLGSGLHDRVATLIDELSIKYGLRIDVWDGLEVVSLLIQYPLIARQFFPGQPSPSLGTSNTDGQPQALRLLTSNRATTFDDETFFGLLENLLGQDVWVFAPGSNAPLWGLYLRANYLELGDSLDRLSSQIRRRYKSWTLVPRRRRAVSWVMLARAAVAARVGSPRSALKLVSRIQSLHVDDPELTAWLWNVRSIAYGKLDNTGEYLRATHKAIRTAQEAGNTWLGLSVKLRMLHKASWAAAESENPLPNNQFEGDIRANLVTVTDLSQAQLLHVRAQEDAYLALQYTWQASSWDLAERAILSAERRFEGVGDASELARMASERGRLYLLSNVSTEAIGALQAGFRRRVHGGEYPRARYDLLWLGQALASQGMTIESETCFVLALSIHDQLYGNQKVDKGVMRQIRSGLEKSNGEVVMLARRRRMDRDYLSGLIGAATTLDEAEVPVLVDLERFKRLLVQHSW